MRATTLTAQFGFHTLRSIALAACVLLAAIPALAGPDATLDPRTYSSPDASYTLHVDPSDASGAGPAKYSLKHDGKELWGGERDFTLWEAVVTDAGVVAGYAYDCGRHGWPRKREAKSHLDILVISCAGVVLQQDQHDREHPNVLSNPPPDYVPVALGIIADTPGNWFAVRLMENRGQDDEKWLPFTFSGKQLSPLTPEQPKHGQYGFHNALSCAIVPGTPLTLVHWYTWDTGEDRVHRDGARLALLDHAGRQVWALDLPDEYSGLGKDGRWSWYYDLVRPGIVQAGMGDKSFWFHSYKLQAKIEFKLTPDASAPSEWAVAEVSRQENAGNPQPAPPPGGAVQEITRAPIGTIHLQTDSPGAAKSPLYNLRSMAIADDGTLAAVRGGSPSTLVLLDDTGKVLGEHSLEGAGPKSDPRVVAISGTRWMIHASGLHSEKPGAWIFDSAAPQAGLTRIDVTTGALKELDAFPDAGFVAITGTEWARASGITKFDPQGHAQWTVEAFCPQDVAATSDGRVAVLEGIHHMVNFFKADGTPDGSWELTKVLGGREPNYVAGLSADRDGGVILYDFSGTPPVYRITKDGKITERMRPRYTDGRAADVVMSKAEASPVDGRIWVAAADGLLRLAGEGVADRMLGDAAGTGRQLRDINALAIDTNGGFYAVNGSDCSVHVFDATGALKKVLRPEPADFVARSGFGSIVVQGDGTIRYTPGFQFDGGGGFLRFGPDGTRIGKERPVLGEVSEEWYGVPGTQRRWAVGYSTFALVGDDGKIIKRISRRPNDQWLGNLGNAGVAPDASIAVISAPAGWGTRGPAFACVYSPTGEPIATLPIPLDTQMLRIAFNGRTVAVTDANEVHLIPVHAGKAGPISRFALPATEGQQGYWYLDVSPKGDELWARNADSTDILRFPFDP